MSLRPGRGQGYPPPPPRTNSGQSPAYGSTSPPATAAASPSSGGGHVYSGYSQPSYYGGYSYNNGSSYGANTAYASSAANPPAYGYSSSTAYGGYSAPAAAPAAPAPTKSLSKRRGAGGRISSGNGGGFAVLQQAWIWTTLLSVVLGGLCIRYRMQVGRLCDELEVDSIDMAMARITSIISSERRVSANVQTIKDSLRIANEHKIALERDNRKLQNELKEMKDHYESPEAHEELDRIIAREEGWIKHVEVLQKRTQRESARSVQEKYVSWLIFAIVACALCSSHCFES